tara:strand:+ start:6295 stop:6702 length:408 start_codon:yes stop_codon:yes gene_type:complete
MSFTPEEATQIKIDVGVLKNTTDKVLSALSDNTEQLTTLISKIDSHDIRREYEAKERLEDKEEVAELKEAVNQVNSRIDAYITDVAPIIARSKSKQDSIDKFKDSMSTTGAKMFMVLIVVAIGAALGLDLSSIVK